MMRTLRCTFTNIGGTRNRCVACGRIIESPHPPEKIHANCRSPEAKAQREQHRLWRVAAADMPTVVRQLITRMVNQAQRSGKSRPIRSEPRLLLILDAFCAKKSQPCTYWTGDQCGNPGARCSNIACAEVACPLGHFGADV